MEAPESETTVVVRSVGERTTEACRHLLQQQVPPENVVLVEGLEYENYVRGAYEVGLDHGRKWTLVVDADVLPKRRMVTDLLEIGLSSGSEFFAGEGWVRDKFFGGPIMGGGTLYRTDLLEEACSVVPQSDAVPRPETETIHRMQERGYSARWERDVVVGVHDYEQSFRDIYRKANRYSRKDEHYLPIMESYWRRAEVDDPDIRVFHRAVEWARQIDSEMSFDATQFSDADVGKILEELDFEEKSPLPPEAISFDDVEERMAEPVPPEYRRYRRLGRVRESSRWQRLPRGLRYLTIVLLQQPFPRAIPWAVGRILERLGEGLQQWAEP